MEFTIFSRYTNPTVALNWWRIELDQNAFPDYKFAEYQIKRPDEWFDAKSAAAVEAMSLFKGTGRVLDHDKAVYDRFADLSIFINLKFLSIPIDAIAYVDIESVADHLEHLHITPPRTSEYARYYEKDRRPLIFEECLPRLKTLGILCSPILFKNFDAVRYPALEWLSTALDFDKSGKGLKLFDNHADFHGFFLESILKKDLLKNIRKDIIGLEFWGMSPREFDFTCLPEFKNLKYLSLRNCKAPIDCSLLTGLPQLLELRLFSFKKFENVEALLRLDNLEKIHIYPDNKSDLSEEFIEKMRKKFSHCSILSFDITQKG
jgi:hypothetical protein